MISSSSCGTVVGCIFRSCLMLLFPEMRTGSTKSVNKNLFGIGSVGNYAGFNSRKKYG